MTSKALSLVYGDITLFFAISNYFCVTIVKVSKAMSDFLR